MKHSIVILCLLLVGTGAFTQDDYLETEKLSGEGIWVHPVLTRKFRSAISITVWFEDQFLGDGKAYLRRANEFKNAKRRKLRSQVVKTLKHLNETSYAVVEEQLNNLVAQKKISALKRHWIVNSFTCNATREGLDEILKLKGVKKIFASRPRRAARKWTGGKFYPAQESEKFDPTRYKHPWYIRYLMADKVWKKFKVTGKGVLNVVHDFNFVMHPAITGNLYRNEKEIPGNNKDDDGNGYIDDYHGFNFTANSSNLTPRPMQEFSMQFYHGACCANIIAGTSRKGYGDGVEFGIAPESKWAGIISQTNLEDAVEWAVEHEVDTYSMSFSLPGLGETRTVWRKIMEHGSFCGIYFASGAGNFGKKGSRKYAPIPVQMRTPEDIPEVVFAAAGIQRNFRKTPFSSKGPVKWETEHYRDGIVQKPEVCGFNSNLPFVMPNGKVIPGGLSGNSFAGPMFCGSIALMICADPDLLPWDLKEIITSTATDVAAKGVDYETGYGLINLYRAVKEVLRRKAVREGKDASRYTGREKGDTLDIVGIKKKLADSKLMVGKVQASSQAAVAGVQQDDRIISLNGVKISSLKDLRNEFTKVRRARAGKFTLTFSRGKETIKKEFTLGPIGFQLLEVTKDPVFQ